MNIYLLNCDNLMSYTHQNLSMYFKYVQIFVCQSFLDQALQKKEREEKERNRGREGRRKGRSEGKGLN